MMRCPRRAMPDQGHARWELIGHRVDPCHVQGFFEAHLREDVRHGVRQQVFPAPGQPNINTVWTKNRTLFGGHCPITLPLLNRRAVILHRINQEARLSPGYNPSGSAFYGENPNKTDCMMFQVTHSSINERSPKQLADWPIQGSGWRLSLIFIQNRLAKSGSISFHSAGSKRALMYWPLKRKLAPT
jgi:hypothetical protein